jgi:ABC-type transporter Mla maintaining outer membrane lipid asymmetry ATPase subunit MlaF
LIKRLEAMASISLEGVTKVYSNGFEAVHDLTLLVPDGQFLVIVGPSGCGKTTVLRMIAGHEFVTAGIIRIGEQIVNDVAPRQRDIAMVFQSYALYPHMSVAENIGFALRMRKVAKSDINRREGGRGDPGTQRMAGAQTRAAFRWPATTGGDGSSDCPRAQRLLDGRVPFQP